jgi:raffinose/stachyose/melibiose transport system substrate-binding protein
MSATSTARATGRGPTVLRGLITLGAVAAFALAGCGGQSGGSGDGKVTLRIAMGSPGEEQIAVWEEAKKQYEAAHSNVTVELNIQEDDLYQTVGLPNVLNGRNAPDIYFEWAGQRLMQRQKDGFAADLTEAMKQPGFADRFDPGAFKGMQIDGKTYMVPGNADVTNVMWYNKTIFAANGLTPPKTWDDLLTACDTLKAKGITPIASGNKDLWPAGNWLGHVISRVAGEDAYDKTLSKQMPLNNPQFVQGLELAKQLHDRGCVNESINAVDDNGGAQLFFSGEAAMHPLGSWLVSLAKDQAPDLNYDYFNLPSTSGTGDQGSVIGVSTGYVVNAKSAHVTEAVEFLKLFSSPAITKLMVESGSTPMTKDPFAGVEADARTKSLTEMMATAPALVSPPDTGYDLKVANALYEAASEVIGGRATPADALTRAQDTIQ